MKEIGPLDIFLVRAICKQMYTRVAQLCAEGFDEKTSKRIVGAEVLFGYDAHWPMQEEVEGLRKIATKGVRMGLEEEGGSVYRSSELEEME